MHRAQITALTSVLALAVAAPAASQVYGQPYSPNAPYNQAPPPAGAYGGPASGGYGGSNSGYGAPASGYGSYGGYGAQNPGGYGAPPPGYGGQPGAYAPPPPGYGAPPAGAYGANTAYAGQTVKCDNNGAIAGGLLGALAGGVLGSNVAGHGKKTEGTVLGGLAMGGVGALVGHAHDQHQCDQRGAYWNYADTVPYRVDNSVVPDPNATDYANRGCRLAPAQVNDQETRYVRVCPDPDGRYRVTG